MNNKRVIFFVLIIMMLSFSSFINAKITGEAITGEVITGKATSSNVGVALTVVGTPSIILYYPDNKTYLKSNLTINFTYFGNPNNFSYAVDGGLNNSLNPFDNISFADGLRFLELWANNGYGSSSDSVFFTVNTSLLSIIYSNFNGSTKGSSSNFYSFAYEDLLNLSGVILENSNYGRINFSVPINVENDSNTSDRVVNINSNIVITNRSISVNSANLPNFNKSAVLYFYNISLTNPRVLVNGVVCPTSLCTSQTFSGGIFSLTVGHFSNFSLEETPINSTGGVNTSGGGGGGGGGGGPSTYHTIDIITPGTVDIGRNDELVVPITIRNPELIVMKGIKLYANSSTKELSAIFENIIIPELLPGQNKTLMLFLKSTNLLPGNYEIELQANVTDPNFMEKEKMYIRAVEIVGKVEVVERILLAQELFRENPECLELNDLLIQAQNLVDLGQVDNAKTIVQEAISRCRDLVTNKESPNTPDYSKLSNWRTPIEIALILVVITLVIFMIFRRPKIDLGRTKQKRKKSFFKRLFHRR